MTQKKLKDLYFRQGRKLGLPYHLAVEYSKAMRGVGSRYTIDFIREVGVLVGQEEHYCASCDEYYFVDRYLMPDGKITYADGHFGDFYREGESPFFFKRWGR